MKKMKKMLASFMVVAMMLTAAPLSGFVGLNISTVLLSKSNATNYQISAGDVIELGSYNNEPIYWICVGFDANGPLMLCKDILCLKEFDAAGYSDKHNSSVWDVRIDHGSNCWSDSNIRQWLNTKGKVDYTHCPPSYADEDGFLSCFTLSELSLVKQVTRKDYVNSLEYDRGYVDGGSREFADVSSISQWDRDNSNYWYQLVSDSFFLLGAQEIVVAYKSNPDYLKASKLYFTSQAHNRGYSHDCLYWINADGSLGGASGGTIPSHKYGIRPSFYLDIDAYWVEQSKITGEFEDYVLTCWFDEYDNIEKSYISPIKIDGVKYNVRENVIETMAKADSYKGKKVVAYRDDEGYVYKIEPIEEKKTNEINWYNISSDSTINYGAENRQLTRSSKALSAANELVSTIQNYMNVLHLDTDDDQIESIVDDLKKGNEAYFNLAKSGLDGSVPDIVKESVYYAIAEFIIEVVNENNIKIKVDPDEEDIEQALNMLKSLFSIFGHVKKTYNYNGYKITLNVQLGNRRAFTGDISVKKYSGANKGESYIGGLVSSEANTKKALVAFANNLSEIVYDECKKALKSIPSEFMSLSGLANVEIEVIEDYFNVYAQELLNGKYGNVCHMFVNINQAYNLIKTFKTAGDANDYLSLNVSMDSNGEITIISRAEELKNKIDKIDFSVDGAREKLVKEAIKRIEEAQKDLSDALYNYIYQVDTGDPANKSWGEKITNYFNEKWNRAEVKCPVEFEVYNVNEELIGYVDSSENHDEYINFNDEIYIDIVNDVKYIYYPAEMEISIKFTAIDDGQMNYSIEQLESGEPTGKINYFDVPLTVGETFEQTIPSNADLQEFVTNTFFETSDTTTSGEYISVEDEAYVTVNCTSDNQGFAIGGGQYSLGSSVKMMAFEDEGCKFQGWYLGDSLVSTDIIYQFTAVEDTEIYALFESVTDFVLKDDADAKIDSENKILFGNDILNYSADTIDSLFKYGNILIESKEKGKLGTGDIVCAVSDRGVICNTLTALVFGDVNGDGWYDGQDAIIVDCFANGMLTKDDVSEAVYMAADCNHDGMIDQLDVDLLNQAGALLANVDQSKSAEVLLETSSEYVEYLDLIDQSPELDIEDETDAPEADAETEDTTPEQDAKVDIFGMIMNFIKSIFEMLLSYIPMPIE